LPKQRSEKEMILNLYFKKYPDVLERILGVDLSQIELEIPHGRKKIDFYAVSKHKELVPYAKKILELMDEAKQRIYEVQGLLKPKLRISAGHTPTTYFLPPSIK